MKCHACGVDVANDAAFCQKCGANLKDPKAAGATPAQRLRGAAGAEVEPERELWRGGYSAKAMLGNWLLALLVSVLVIAGAVTLQLFVPATLPALPIVIGVAAALVGLVWLYMFGVWLYRAMAVQYELTTQRFIHKVGIFSRVTDRVEVIDIDDVAFKQGFVERMMGVGTIHITSSDRSHPNLVLIGIDKVSQVSNLIDDTRRAERRKRGLHIEAI